MKLVLLSTMCLAILWLVPAPQFASADDPAPPPVTCGWVVTGTCPGCSASTPPDSTCACGVNQEGCDCVKAGGGIQNGQIVLCNSDNFSYNADWDGYVITEGENKWCKKVKKCRWKDETGGETDCGDLLGGQCTNVHACSWRVVVTTEQKTYVQGSSCSGGPE